MTVSRQASGATAGSSHTVCANASVCAGKPCEAAVRANKSKSCGGWLPHQMLGTRIRAGTGPMRNGNYE